MAMAGRRTKNTYGNAANVKRSAVSNSGSTPASPNLVIGKFSPQTAVTNTARARCFFCMVF